MAPLMAGKRIIRADGLTAAAWANVKVGRDVADPMEPHAESHAAK